MDVAETAPSQLQSRPRASIVSRHSLSPPLRRCGTPGTARTRTTSSAFCALQTTARAGRAGFPARAPAPGEATTGRSATRAASMSSEMMNGGTSNGRGGASPTRFTSRAVARRQTPPSRGRSLSAPHGPSSPHSRSKDHRLLVIVWKLLRFAQQRHPCCVRCRPHPACFGTGHCSASSWLPSLSSSVPFGSPRRGARERPFRPRRSTPAPHPGLLPARSPALREAIATFSVVLTLVSGGRVPGAWLMEPGSPAPSAMPSPTATT